jgi:TonB family protein
MSKYTILLIDYEPRSIESLKGPLESVGYRVEVASDGISGVEMFDSLKPDLTLIEAMIPKKHGFEVCQQLKATEHGTKTPIAILTAVYKGRKYRSQALHSYKCDEYLEKPIDADYLLQTVGKLLHIEDPYKPLGGDGVPEVVEVVQEVDPAADEPAPASTGPRESLPFDLTGADESAIMDRLDEILADDDSPPAAQSTVEPTAAKADSATVGSTPPVDLGDLDESHLDEALSVLDASIPASAEAPETPETTSEAPSETAGAEPVEVVDPEEAPVDGLTQALEDPSEAPNSERTGDSEPDKPGAADLVAAADELQEESDAEPIEVPESFEATQTPVAEVTESSDDGIPIAEAEATEVLSSAEGVSPSEDRTAKGEGIAIAGDTPAESEPESDDFVSEEPPWMGAEPSTGASSSQEEATTEAEDKAEAAESPQPSEVEPDAELAEEPSGQAETETAQEAAETGQVVEFDAERSRKRRGKGKNRKKKNKGRRGESSAASTGAAAAAHAEPLHETEPETDTDAEVAVAAPAASAEPAAQPDVAEAAEPAASVETATAEPEPAKRGGLPGWIWIAAAVLVIGGAVGVFVLRGSGGAPEAASPKPAASTTTPPVPESTPVRPLATETDAAASQTKDPADAGTTDVAASEVPETPAAKPVAESKPAPPAKKQPKPVESKPTKTAEKSPEPAATAPARNETAKSASGSGGTSHASAGAPAPAIRQEPKPEPVVDRSNADFQPARRADVGEALEQPAIAPPPLSESAIPEPEPPKWAGRLVDLADADVAPQVIQRTLPEYTRRAMRLRQEGTVQLEVLVSDDGSVIDVKVIKPIPNSDLNEAAVDAVRTWRYRPAQKEGQAVKVWKPENVQFKL